MNIEELAEGTVTLLGMPKSYRLTLNNDEAVEIIRTDGKCVCAVTGQGTIAPMPQSTVEVANHVMKYERLISMTRLAIAARETFKHIWLLEGE